MNDSGWSGCTSSRSLPEMMRLMSSRSSMSCVCTRALRSIVSRPLQIVGRRSFGPLRSTCDQPRMALSGVRSSCESVARNSSLMSLSRSAAAARRALALEQRLALLGRLLRRFVEPRVVDGDAGLRRHADDEPLGAFGEHAGLPGGRRTGRRSPRRSATAPAPPGSCAPADALRHAVVRRHRAVARVLQDVVAADRRLAAKRRAEQRRRARLPELLERLARRARQRVEQERVAAVVGRVVEERAELGAAQLRRRIGHRLDDRLQVELRRERLAGLVQQLEDARLLAQRRFGPLARRDVLDRRR